MNVLGFEIARPRSVFHRSPATYAIPVIASGIVLVGATAAYAAWTTNGTGTASAKAGTASPLTTTAAAVTTNLLFPGGTGDVKITINNPNPYNVRITQVAGSGTITAAGGTGTCTTTGVTFTTQTGTYDVSANSSATFTLAGAAAMSTASQDGCQGATFTIPVALTGASN